MKELLADIVYSSIVFGSAGFIVAILFYYLGNFFDNDEDM